MRLALLLIAVISFPLNYIICDLLYSGDDVDSINNWNTLNIDITHTIIFVSLLSIQLLLNTKAEFIIGKWYQFILYVGIGFSSADVIDRWLFDERRFNLISDSIMVTIVLIAGYRKYLIQKFK